MTRVHEEDPSHRRLGLIWRALFTLALATLIVAPGLAGSATTRVLLVGDSWTFFLWQNRSMRDSFAAHGRSDVVELGGPTTINGSTAADWTDPGQLQLITDALVSNSDIEVVQVTLGGNDFLDGQPDGWWVTMGDPAEQVFFAQVLEDLETVVDHVLQLDPELRVLISLYDYPNFEDSLFCGDRFTSLGSPTPLQINTALVDFSAYLLQITTTRPRVEVRTHAGLMQYLFGIPGVASPGELPPPGNPNFPSPISSMLLGFDCIHLAPDGYYGVAESLWWSYYYGHFGGLFESGFETGDLSDWD